MMKKLTTCLLLLLMMTSACAEIEWPAAMTTGQAALRNYVDNVNQALAQQGAGVIDMQYELYPAFASLGLDGAEAPETAELSFLLGDGGLHSLTLRMCDADRFEQVASTCLAAASSSISLESARSLVAPYVDVMRNDLAAKNTSPEDAMTHSFEETVNELQSDQPRAYFAYYPNQFGDGCFWLQMTLIFARPGSAGSLAVTGLTTPAPTEDVEYEGYFAQDNFNHLEVFTTPTPEPDSAAMEDW